MKNITARFRTGDRKASLLKFRLKILANDLKLPDYSIEEGGGKEPAPTLAEVTSALAQAAYTLHELADKSRAEWKRSGHAAQSSRAVDKLLAKCKRSG